VTAAEFGGVDVDLLADYIGGALAGTPDEAAVAGRIAGDPAWRDAYAELSAGMAAVGAELGRWEPEPMPAELADRLDTLLTSPVADPAPIPAELATPPGPHLSAVRGSGAVDDGAHGVREKKGRRREAHAGRRLRWATPIAIAAGVVAFIGFGLDYLSGQHKTADRATSAGAGVADSNAQEKAAPQAAGGISTLQTGTDYTAATLTMIPGAQALSAPNGGSAGVKPQPNRHVAEDAELDRLRAPDALQACLDAIGQENGLGAISPTTVDYARYDGKPAIVVRFTAANGSWAWASGASCGTGSGGADTLGKAPVR
jgi:hypothetical protein